MPDAALRHDPIGGVVLGFAGNLAGRAGRP